MRKIKNTKHGKTFSLYATPIKNENDVLPHYLP